MENPILSILMRGENQFETHQGDTQRGRHEAERCIHKPPEAERSKEQSLARGSRGNVSLLTP